MEDLQRRLERLEERIKELTLQNRQMLENLKHTVAQRAAKKDKKEIRIFTLRNLQTDEVAATILALFGSSPANKEGAGGIGVGATPIQGAGVGGFGGMFGNVGNQFGMMGAIPVPNNPSNLELDPAKLRVATIERTNTIIVRGEPDDLQLIEGLITKLEKLAVPEKPRPERKKSEGKFPDKGY